MRRSAAGVAVAVVSVLGACSADGGGDAGTTSSTVTPLTVDAAAAPFCDAFGALLVGPLAEGGFDAGVPEELAAAIDATRPSVVALRETAPPEIAEAAGQVADAYEAAFGVLDRYGADLARVDAEATPEERAALDAFGRPPVGPGIPDPYEAVEAFVADRCAPGITIPPDLTATTSP